MSDLPVGWEWTTLAEVAYISGGIQKQPKRVPRDKSAPFLRVANVQRGSLDLADVHRVELFEGELAAYRLVAGDLLVVEGNGSIGQLGRSAVWRGEIEGCVHQNHLIRVRPGPAIDAEFLGAVWNSELVSSQLAAVAGSTSGLHTLSVAKLSTVRLPLPPLAEQRRVVGEIDDHLMRVRYSQRLLAEARAKLPLAAASTRASLVGDSGIGVIGDRGVLADVLDRIEAGRSFGGSTRPAEVDEWGIVKVSAMTWGRFDETQNKQIPAEAADPRYEIRSGDILVSRANTESYVGAPVLVDDVRPRLLLSDKSLRLISRPGVDRRWLLHVLASPGFRAHISRTATGTKDSMRNISQAALLQAPIAIPQKGEQRRLADEIDDRLQDLQRLEISVHVAMARSDQLRRSVLADAFAGRLVPQDPTDEPAAELLARIRAERAAQPAVPGRRRVRRTPE